MTTEIDACFVTGCGNVPVLIGWIELRGDPFHPTNVWMQVAACSGHVWCLRTTEELPDGARPVEEVINAMPSVPAER
jgi:hypothetical protein